MEMETN